MNGRFLFILTTSLVAFGQCHVIEADSSNCGSSTEQSALVDVKKCGAKGDGRVIWGLLSVQGAKTGTKKAVVSAAPLFRSDDVGKLIVVSGAGPWADRCKDPMDCPENEVNWNPPFHPTRIRDPLVTRITELQDCGLAKNLNLRQCKIAILESTPYADVACIDEDYKNHRCASATLGTDDKIAIAKAYRKSAAAHGTLYFPPGLYLTSETIRLSGSDFISIRGNGRHNTLVYHTPPNTSGQEGGCVLLDVEKDQLAVSYSKLFYQIRNLASADSIVDIGLGSTAGPALTFHGASNVVTERVWLFSAGSDTANLRINGGAMNQFSNCLLDAGNQTSAYGKGPALDGLVESTGKHSVWIQSTDRRDCSNTPDPHGCNGDLPINITEAVFTNCRIDGASRHAKVMVAGNSPAMNTVFGIEFNSCYVKPGPEAAYVVDGAHLKIEGGYLEPKKDYDEPAGFIPDGIVARSNNDRTYLFVNNLESYDSLLRLEKGKNKLEALIWGSSFQSIKCEGGPSIAYSNLWLTKLGLEGCQPLAVQP